MGRFVVVIHLALGVGLIALLVFFLSKREDLTKGSSGSLGSAQVELAREVPPTLPIVDPQVPPLTFTSHTGQRIDSLDLRGSHLLVFFGFSSCPDICPGALARTARVMRLLGDDAERILPVFISFDPERDSVEVLAKYVPSFHPRLLGLTGSADEIARAARAYGVYYEKVEASDGDPSRYTMDHTSRTYLVGPGGNGIVTFSHSSTAEEITSAVREMLSQAPRVAVDRPWSRATGGLAHAGVVYLSLRNDGAASDRLVSVNTPAADEASIHETRMEGDRMRMRHLDALDLPPESVVSLEPGGLHIMLMGLSAPLEAGRPFPLILGFERAGRVEVEVRVEAADAMAPAAAGS